MLVLYLNIKVYYRGDARAVQFWRAACASSFLIGLMVITRMTPIFLIPGLFFLYYIHAYAGRSIIWAGRVLRAPVSLLQVVITHRESKRLWIYG